MVREALAGVQPFYYVADIVLPQSGIKGSRARTVIANNSNDKVIHVPPRIAEVALALPEGQPHAISRPNLASVVYPGRVFHGGTENSLNTLVSRTGELIKDTGFRIEKLGRQRRGEPSKLYLSYSAENVDPTLYAEEFISPTTSTDLSVIAWGIKHSQGLQSSFRRLDIDQPPEQVYDAVINRTTFPPDEPRRSQRDVVNDTIRTALKRTLSLVQSKNFPDFLNPLDFPDPETHDFLEFLATLDRTTVRDQTAYAFMEYYFRSHGAKTNLLMEEIVFQGQ